MAPGPRRWRSGRVGGQAANRLAQPGACRERSAAPRQRAVAAGAGQDPGRLGRCGKSTRALGTALRERGHRQAVEAVIARAVAALAEHTSTKAACDLLGWSRATHYRARRPARLQLAGPRPAPPNALSAAECERVLAELNSRRFVDKSVGQCWATLLDEGSYLCSMSTMHRLLRGAGQAGERRHQATHPTRAKPELLATAPLHVWS